MPGSDIKDDQRTLKSLTKTLQWFQSIALDKLHLPMTFLQIYGKMALLGEVGVFRSDLLDTKNVIRLSQFDGGKPW